MATTLWLLPYGYYPMATTLCKEIGFTSLDDMECIFHLNFMPDINVLLLCELFLLSPRGQLKELDVHPGQGLNKDPSSD